MLIIFVIFSSWLVKMANHRLQQCSVTGDGNGLNGIQSFDGIKIFSKIIFGNLCTVVQIFSPETFDYIFIIIIFIIKSKPMLCIIDLV